MRDFYLCYPAILTNTLVPQPGLSSILQNQLGVALDALTQANSLVERYEVSNKFYSCKMEENSSVSEHILRMYGYHNHLTQLGVNLPDDSVIDRVLQSLPPSL